MHKTKFFQALFSHFLQLSGLCCPLHTLWFQPTYASRWKLHSFSGQAFYFSVFAPSGNTFGLAPDNFWSLSRRSHIEQGHSHDDGWRTRQRQGRGWQRWQEHGGLALRSPLPTCGGVLRRWVWPQLRPQHHLDTLLLDPWNAPRLLEDPQGKRINH